MGGWSERERRGDEGKGRERIEDDQDLRGEEEKEGQMLG